MWGFFNHEWTFFICLKAVVRTHSVVVGETSWHIPANHCKGDVMIDIRNGKQTRWWIKFPWACCIFFRLIAVIQIIVLSGDQNSFGRAFIFTCKNTVELLKVKIYKHQKSISWKKNHTCIAEWFNPSCDLTFFFSKFFFFY